MLTSDISFVFDGLSYLMESLLIANATVSDRTVFKNENARRFRSLGASAQSTESPLSSEEAPKTAAMYIRQSKLKHLKEYKYSGVDHSLTSKYILKPFYGQFIKLFPMSMA